MTSPSLLRTIRLKKKMGVRELGRQANISPSYICDIELRGRTVSREVAMYIMEKIGEVGNQELFNKLVRHKTCPKCGNQFGYAGEHP